MARLAVSSIAALASTPLTAVMAMAQQEGAARAAAGLSISTGVLGAAFLSAIWLIRERGRTASENTELKNRMAELSGALSRAEALLNLKDQRIIVWQGNQRPIVLGDLSPES